MKHNRFSEEQTIPILKEYEADARMADLSRKHGGSKQSFYCLQSKYGRMSVSEVLAMLDHKALKELVSKE